MPPRARKRTQTELADALNEAITRYHRFGDSEEAVAEGVRQCIGIDFSVLLHTNMPALVELCDIPLPLEVMEEVLATGVDMRLRGFTWGTPLQAALWSGNVPLARLLLRWGAQLAGPVFLEAPDSVALLVDEVVGLGAAVDAVEHEGHHTALQDAVVKRPPKIRLAIALMEAGADVLAREMHGDSCVDYVTDLAYSTDAEEQRLYDIVMAAAEGGEADRLRRVAGHMRRWAWAKRREAVVACVERLWE